MYLGVAQAPAIWQGLSEFTPVLSAPSSPEDASISQRQRQALLPTELEPSGSAGKQEQEVESRKGQELSRVVDDIRQAAEKANQYFKQAETHLEFVVSEQTGRVVIKVIDSNSHEVVRQIPPEKMARFANMASEMRGLLFDTKG